MNKKLTLGLSIGSIIALSITISSFLLINKSIDNNDGTSMKTEIINQQQIKISSIKYSNTNYGSQTIHYSVNPKINTDEVAYSLKYSDDTLVEEDIFSVTFMPSSNYIDITCLKPFTNQVILSIYAKSNENIRASITIDFLERITLNPVLEINTDSPLKINPNLESTGGSILIDKTIKKESISFSESFVDLIKNKLKERFENVYYTNPQTTTYDQLSTKYFGLEQSDCDKLFSNNFTYGSFIENIYYEVEYSWIESDSDYETYEHEKMYISELLKEDFYTIFDGETSVFSYSCEVNDQKYTKQLGLLIDSIDINSITINNKNIVF